MKTRTLVYFILTALMIAITCKSAFAQKMVENFYHTPSDTFGEFGREFKMTSDSGFLLIGDKRDSILITRKVNRSRGVEWTKQFSGNWNSFISSTADSGFLFGYKDYWIIDTIIKTDNNGRRLWSVHVDSFGTVCNVFATADSGLVYTTIQGGISGYDSYIVKLDKNCKVQWWDNDASGNQRDVSTNGIFETKNFGIVWVVDHYTGLGTYKSLFHSYGKSRKTRVIVYDPILDSKVIDTKDGALIVVTGFNTAYAYYYYYIEKIDTAGNLKWSVSFDSIQQHTGEFGLKALTETIGGYLLLTEDPSGNANRLIKIDPSGNILWKKQYGKGRNPNFSSMICRDSSYALFGYGLDSGFNKFYLISPDSVIFTGIEKQSDNSNISIYPNPANSMLYLQTNNSSLARASAHVYVSDLSGKTLMNQQIHLQQTSIDVSTLPSGIYFIHYQDNEKVWNGKFEKE